MPLYLRKLNLSGKRLIGVDLHEANLTETKLNNAILWQSEWTNLKNYLRPILGAVLNGVNLKNSDLSGANLRGADLYGADLSGANLSKADLRSKRILKE